MIILIIDIEFRRNIVNINKVVFEFVFLTRLIVLKILIDVIIFKFFALIRFFKSDLEFEIVES